MRDNFIMYYKNKGFTMKEIETIINGNLVKFNITHEIEISINDKDFNIAIQDLDLRENGKELQEAKNYSKQIIKKHGIDIKGYTHAA